VVMAQVQTYALLSVVKEIWRAGQSGSIHAVVKGTISVQKEQGVGGKESG